MDPQARELIHSIYSPPRSKSYQTIEEIYKGSDVFSFSLARHGLRAGLEALGLKKGDAVLLPSFICRDVLAPFNLLGLKILFYQVDKELKIIGSINDLPKARAILAVHYFGLETDLDPFFEYCKQHDSFLIEDNAHGFLSRSAQGKLLGTSGDFGIISVRKTLPIVNGAILLCKTSRFSIQSLKATDFISWRLAIKNTLRPLVASWGASFLLVATKMKRRLRLLLKGQEVPESQTQDEWEIPGSPSPVNFNKYIARMDLEKEISRRRALFAMMNEFLKEESIVPVRMSLSKNEVPYGYPFFCSQDKISSVKSRLESVGLEIVTWPALPSEVVSSYPPDFYGNLYLVRFLW